MATGNVVRLPTQTAAESFASTDARPSLAQFVYLQRGLDQAGGKLPLFDRDGQRVDEEIVRSCIDRGWAEPWFANKLKPDWLVCKLTPAGRAVVSD
ncbi:MAG: hypothetical protein AB7F36_07850 [Reyranellaceae bacterium]